MIYSVSSFGQKDKEDQIDKLEKIETGAIQRSDTATLSKVWHKDFVVNNPYGVVVTVPQIFSFIRKGELDYSTLERIPEKMIFVENLAIAMGREIVTPQHHAPNACKKITRRYSHVWIKTKSSWQLLARQASNFLVE